MTATNTTTSTGPAKFTLDPAHSSVGFSVRHMMITNVKGEFQKISGSATFDPSKLDATQLEATVDAASINTREAQRDTHLKSADFLDVEKFPTLTFKSKKALPKGGDKLDLVGDLTIRGVTKEVTLHVSDITPEHGDPWGNRRIGATATTKIKRSEFGITWNNVIEAGGVLVGDDITITLEASLIKSK